MIELARVSMSFGEHERERRVMKTVDSLRMLSIAEVARVLGVSVFTVRRLIKAGEIRAVNVGARVVVASVEVERVMAQGAGQGR